ncbi:hypothetical protein GALL_467960 [mine drainage metagenome]|uniref:Uncharacterized protein n=1 Tax=mine drainage metagenome TaxID=410659 RepID=A0A1J5PJ21_9ZZZZ
MLVVHFDTGRYAASVIDHTDRIIRMNRDQDVVAVTRQRLINRVVDHLEDQVVQARAIRGIADVHARALAHCFEAFQNLDRAFAIGF